MVASVVGMYYTVLVTGSRDIVASAVGIHCTVLVTCSRDIVASAVGTHCTVLVPHCRVVRGTSSACSSGQLLVCIGLVIIFLLRTLYSNTQSSAMLRYDILVTAKYDAPGVFGVDFISTVLPGRTGTGLVQGLRGRHWYVWYSMAMGSNQLGLSVGWSVDYCRWHRAANESHAGVVFV